MFLCLPHCCGRGGGGQRHRSERDGQRQKRWRGKEAVGLGERRWLGDREGVKAGGDTSRCQTHRHTAATDSSLRPRSAGTTGRRKSELQRKSAERTAEEESGKTNEISQLAKICPASCCWRPISLEDEHADAGNSDAAPFVITNCCQNSTM